MYYNLSSSFSCITKCFWALSSLSNWISSNHSLVCEAQSATEPCQNKIHHCRSRTLDNAALAHQKRKEWRSFLFFCYIQFTPFRFWFYWLMGRNGIIRLALAASLGISRIKFWLNTPANVGHNFMCVHFLVGGEDFYGGCNDARRPQMHTQQQDGRSIKIIVSLWLSCSSFEPGASSLYFPNATSSINSRGTNKKFEKKKKNKLQRVGGLTTSSPYNISNYISFGYIFKADICQQLVVARILNVIIISAVVSRPAKYAYAQHWKFPSHFCVHVM